MKKVPEGKDFDELNTKVLNEGNFLDQIKEFEMAVEEVVELSDTSSSNINDINAEDDYISQIMALIQEELEELEEYKNEILENNEQYRRRSEKIIDKYIQDMT